MLDSATVSAFFDEMEKCARVIGHIAGASGSGKTTLLKRLQRRFPDLVTKDTDEFHDAAHVELGLGSDRPDKAKYRKTYSRLAQDFLKKNKDKSVLLGGGKGKIPGVEMSGDKMLLDTGAVRSSIRRYRRKNERPWVGKPERLRDIPGNILQARKHIKEFKERGYKALSPEQISQVVGERLRGR